MKKVGILFDYNGVLVDDEHIHEETFRQALEPYGIDLTHAMHLEHIQGRKGTVGMQTMINLFPDNLSSVTAKQLLHLKVKAYKKAIAETSILYDGVRGILEIMSSHFKMGLVTSSLRELVEPYLQREGIYDYFDAIVTADDIEHGKPNPEPYQKGIAMLGISSDNCVAIEDTAHGIQAAKAAELKCIAVLHTLPKEKLGEADLIIPGIRDLSQDVIERALN